MEISSNVINGTVLAKTELIVWDIFFSSYVLAAFVFCSKPQLLAFISSLYKQVQLITYNENNTKFSLVKWFDYLQVSFVCFIFFLFPLGSQHGTHPLAIIISRVCCMKQLCFSVT